MSILKQDVLHVARLAHLELTEAELDAMTRQLGKILEHVKQLGTVDTRGVAPTAHLAIEQLPLGADIETPSLGQVSATAEAPRVLSGGFAVPAFVDD